MKKIIVLGLAIFLAFAAAGCIPKASAKVPLQLNEVKAGKVTAGDYLNSLAETMPAVRDAKASGMLAGILYDPSDKEMEGRIAKIFRENGIEEKLALQLISANLARYAQARNDPSGGLTFLPTSHLIGQKLPSYLIGLPNFISVVETDGDVEGMLLHELQHIADAFAGVNLGDISIGSRNFVGKEISVNFWTSFGELRATHRELIRIFWYNSAKRNAELSELYTVNVGLRYASLYAMLERQAATPFEKAIAKAQISEYQDIVPYFRADGVRLDFNINGRTERFFIVLKKEKVGLRFFSEPDFFIY